MARERRSASILIFGANIAGPPFHKDNSTHKKAKEQEKTYPQADKKFAPTVIAAFRGWSRRSLLLPFRSSRDICIDGLGRGGIKGYRS